MADDRRTEIIPPSHREMSEEDDTRIVLRRLPVVPYDGVLKYPFLIRWHYRSEAATFARYRDAVASAAGALRAWADLAAAKIELERKRAAAVDISTILEADRLERRLRLVELQKKHDALVDAAREKAKSQSANQHSNPKDAFKAELEEKFVKPAYAQEAAEEVIRDIIAEAGGEQNVSPAMQAAFDALREYVRATVLRTRAKG